MKKLKTISKLFTIALVIFLVSTGAIVEIPEYNYNAVDLSIDQNKIVYTEAPDICFEDADGMNCIKANLYIMNLTDTTLENVRFYIHVENNEGQPVRLKTVPVSIDSGKSVKNFYEPLTEQYQSVISVGVSIDFGEEFDLLAVEDVCPENSVRLMFGFAFIITAGLMIILGIAYIVLWNKRQANMITVKTRTKDGRIATYQTQNPVHDDCSIEDWHKNHATLNDGGSEPIPKGKCEYCGYVNNETVKKCILCGGKVKK